MTYQPKPGDRVTSPLLVGEWVVDSCDNQAALRARVFQRPSDGDLRLVELDTADLTPVAPPLPPEPAVGSVVRAHGRYWARTSHGDWGSPGVAYSKGWHGLATAPDLSPVVAVDDVAGWLRRPENLWGTLAHDFRAEFGGWDK